MKENMKIQVRDNKLLDFTILYKIRSNSGTEKKGGRNEKG